MATFTIELDDHVVERIRQIAAVHGMGIEEWIKDYVTQIAMCLQTDKQTLENAVQYVFEKNAELYKRLA